MSKNKKIGNMANKAASVLMCAAMVGSTALPVSTVPVLAADDSTAVEVTETSTDVEVAGTDDAKPADTSASTEGTTDTKPADTKSDDGEKKDDTASGKTETETVDAESVYVTTKDGETPVAIKKATAIADALSQVLGTGGVTIDLTGMRMDAIAADGTRTVVVGTVTDVKADESKDNADSAKAADDTKSDDKKDESGKTDAVSGSLSTIGDIYDYVDKAGAECNFVVYNAQGEICRLAVSKGAATDRSALTVTKAADTTTYKVTYDANGGKLDKEFVTVRGAGEKVSYFDVTASCDGKTFDGWYDAKEGGNQVTADTAVSGDMTVYAHWKTNTVTITFDANGGKEVKAQTANVGDTVKELPKAEKDGAVFDGWYDAKEGGNKVTELKAEKDVTLYAHWKANTITITFDANGGKEVKAQTAKVGDTVKELPKAEKDGAVFDGWYDAKEGGNKVTELKAEKDVTLYAHWNANAVTITFDANGGDEVKAQTAKVGDTVKDLPKAERKGYTFDGWYDAKEGGNKVTELKAEKDVTLYAHWTEKKVTTLELSKHEMTLKSGEKIDLGYKYGPKDATNAEFVWSSSDPQVLAVTEKDGKVVFSYKGTGTTKITIATKDGSISDSCNVTVTSDKNGDNNGSDNNGGDNNSGGDNNGDANATPTPTPSETPEATPTPTEEAVKQLTLNFVMTDGSTKKVTVKDDVQLNNLIQTLGFTNVSAYKYRTASNNTETSMDAATTMKTIAEMAEKEEVLIIGYDSTGNAVGCGKVTKTSDDTYTVTLSKDTNVALSTNDGKGKGEGESNSGSESSSPVSQEGKGDSQASPVKTSDTNVLPIYGGLGALMTTLIGVLAYIKKKALREL